MSDASALTVAVAQLERARDEICSQIAARQAELGRVTAALELLLAKSVRPAPAGTAAAPPAGRTPVLPAAISRPAPAAPKPGTPPATHAAMARILTEAPSGWFTASDVARFGSLPTVCRALKALLEAGKLERRGNRGSCRYRLAAVDGDPGEAVSDPPEAAAGKGASAVSTPRVAVSSPRVAVSSRKGHGVHGGRGSPEEDRRAAVPPAVPAASTAAVNPTPASEDRDLQTRIEDVLERQHGPLEARELARILVAPLGEVAQQLQLMVAQSEAGERYPGVHRDAAGSYCLLARRTP